MIKKILKKIIALMRGGVYIENLMRAGLRIGVDCHILSGVILDSCHCWLITIGDEVTIAPRARIMAHDASTKRHLGYTKIGKVTIGKRVFVGAEALILPGVTIGENSIIGAGSVVTKDIPPNAVAAGNPAKVICTLDDYLAKHKELMSLHPCFGIEYTNQGNVTSAMKEEMKRKMNKGVGYVV
jgi:maltose O-acetyltransferase